MVDQCRECRDGGVTHPGSCPGHVSLWRERDRLLVAGDAFITTRQESAYAALTQAPEMHGPPVYFTPDWVSARSSVQRLAALSPDVVVTGHGQAMQGQKMRAALHGLAERFDEVAVPQTGRYALKWEASFGRPFLADAAVVHICSCEEP
jgi:glyoxylase-like metal-dependent hydrolase (beta-lactamase superfamily II)